MMMMTLATICLMVGMVLGQRCKVPVLLPTIAIALIFVVGAGIARADTIWWIVMMAGEAVTSLQIGYVVGIGICHILMAAQASRSPATSLSGSAPARH